jgi:UDP-N-acetylmuramyl pentapeptide phosphotransferase/UDP-N-acetylglucosamine-1-phosphate transferase
VLVLKVIGVAAGILAVVTPLIIFERYVSRRHGFSFLSKRAFAAPVIAAALVMGGGYWRHQAQQTGGDELNGIVLMVLGAAGVLGILVWNIRRAGVLVGTGGTLLHAGLLGVFCVLASLGLVVLLIGFGLYFVLHMAAALNARPVYVINRRR